MKKITLLSFLINAFIGFSQCPSENILLTTQADVDNFATNYPGCTMLTHELKVDSAGTDVTNLNGLAQIVQAQDIFILSSEITSLQGLHNVQNVTRLALWFNGNLQNLEGLSSLESAGSLEIWINNGMTSLVGAPNLMNLERLNLFDNVNLADISQLSFLEDLTSLIVRGNALETLAGLENITTIDEDVQISNEQIQNFDELSSLQSIGGALHISNHEFAEDLSAFINIDTLVDLYITECPSVFDFSGMENIEIVTGRLRIGFNPGLENLNDFSKLTDVGELDVYENPNLISVDGLEGIANITGRLLIFDNPVLTSIEGLNDVLPGDIQEVAIGNNVNLSICSIDLICAVIDDPDVNKVFFNNAIGCNTVEEVEEACLLLGVDDVALGTLYTAS